MGDLTVTYKDLGFLTMFIAFLVISFFLIKALIYAGRVLRQLGGLLADNADEMDRVIKDMPKLSENAVSLSGHAVEIAEAFRNEQDVLDEALENIAETVELAADTARAINEDLFGGIKKLAKLIAVAVGYLTKKGGGRAAGGESNEATAEGRCGKDGGAAAEGRLTKDRIGLTIESDVAGAAAGRTAEAAAATGRGRRRFAGKKREVKTERRRRKKTDKLSAERVRSVDKDRNININIR